jgi:polyisoprenoid-binding protein YceI
LIYDHEAVQLGHTDCMGRYVLDPGRSQVWIAGSSSVHPVHATATGLEGWADVDIGSEPVIDAGEVRIEVERLRSGNPLVDRETRRRIDARRFPEIVGTVASAERLGDGRLAVTATVAFRGEECRVEGELILSTDADVLVMEGSQIFDVRDWGLEPPRLALLKVHPEVEVRVHLEARPEET